MYIDDLLRSLEDMNVGCRIHNRAVNVLAYADDIVLLSPSRLGLQKLVDRCQSFALERSISFNVKKTVCMTFNPQRPYSSSHLSNSKSPIITLCGSVLTWVTHFKYLGHVIDDKLKDDGDMRRIKRSLYYSANMLCALLGQANKDVLMKLFKSYCTNLYGCELWDVVRDKTAFRQLCVAYHSCIKKLVRVPKSFRNHSLCYALGILPLPMLVAKRQLLFFKRLLCCDNVIVKTLFDSDDVGQNGILAKNHLSVRREYGLMEMDLLEATQSSINNVFDSHLARVANGQHIGDAERERLLRL